MTTPGLLAPTEVIPTPNPWSISRWRMLSRTRQLVWSGVAMVTIATMLGLAINADDVGTTTTDSSGLVSSTSPPIVAGPVVMAPQLDTAKPPPKPSERAAAILQANAVKGSACPVGDTLPRAKPIAFAVFLDSIADRGRAEKMDVRYDVCGLGRSAPFTAHFKLEKLNQRRPIGRQGPIETNSIETVAGLRSRERYTLDISKASAGDYRLDIFVVDKAKREVKASREFRITDK
jgi:hypothetical protein